MIVAIFFLPTYQCGIKKKLLNIYRLKQKIYAFDFAQW